MKKIIFFGDSLTAGFGLQSASTSSFPALLQFKINELELDYTIVNAGVSGDTTTAALLRLDEVLRHETDIFVVALGANDMIRNYPPQVTSDNLRQIINTVKKRYPNARLVILGMELPSWITVARVTQYRDIFSKIAQEYNAPFLPFLLDGVAGQRSLNLPDGLHPNAEGYHIIAAKVWPLLYPLL